MALTPSKIVRVLDFSSDSDEEGPQERNPFCVKEVDYLQVTSIINRIESDEIIPTVSTTKVTSYPTLCNITVNTPDLNELDLDIVSNEVPIVNAPTSGDDAFAAGRAISIRDKKKQSKIKYKNQLLREKGEAYFGREKAKLEAMRYNVIKCKRQMKTTCTSKFCEKSTKRACHVFTESDRLLNFNNFWAQSWEEKKASIKTLVENTEPQSQNNPLSPRSQCLRYYLFMSDGKRHQVCQSMFCSTLDMSRKTIYSWVSKLDKENESGETKTQEKVTGKKRRKKSATQIKQEQKMKDLAIFLDSLSKIPSHYCRASSKRNYLERQFNSISQVYELYKEEVKGKPLCWASFHKVFQDKRLSIFKAKKDQCNVCATIEGDVENTEHYLENKRAQDEKRRDKANIDPEKYVFCADVQSALPVPQLFVNATYYRSKLNCHNYTIYSLYDTAVDCYFWSEDEAGLEADVFISCVLDHLTSVKRDRPSLKHVIMYTDSCPAQNKNVKLSNALLHFCVEHDIIIEQKFLVVGHTYMEADSVHSMIERQCRHKVINSPMEYIKMIVAARLKQENRPAYVVHYKDHKFFSKHQYEYYSSIRPGIGSGQPKVNNLRAIRYQPNGEMLFKLSFQDHWQPLPKKLSSPIFKHPTRLYRKKPGLTEAKKKHLGELLEYVQCTEAVDFFKKIIN